MSEQDFIMAWVLAARVGRTDVWAPAKLHGLIESARHTYKQLMENANETNS